MWRFILHVTGADNVSGHWYAFWSGFGADLPEFVVFLVVWKKLTCDVAGCRRLGFRRVHGTYFTTCWKHHPDGKNNITAKKIAEQQQGTII